VGLEKFPVRVFGQVTHLDVELRKASPDVRSCIGQKQGWLVLFSFKMHLHVCCCLETELVGKKNVIQLDT